MGYDVVASIDGKNQVRLEIFVKGLYQTKLYNAIVDTGFSGGLVLPLIVAVDIGLEKSGAAAVTLADGSTKVIPTFLCQAQVGADTHDLSTLIMGSDVLIGMELLLNYRLCIAPASGEVTISANRQDVEYMKLVSDLRQMTGGR